MNKTLKLAGAFLALALSSSALAIPITGGISLAGGITPNTGDVTTATSFSFSGVFVTAGGGTFLGLGSSPVTHNPLVVPLPALGIVPLWQITATPTISFDLLSISSDINGVNTRGLQGMGMLNYPGYDPTMGTWVFTANQASGTFSFSSSNGAVPDGGATAALLGLTMVGLGFMRRFAVRA